ncbi:zinc finger protein [Rutstroemia sp. NJR-2017a WRK4]|nr:zinc finger protein [Rutstroemia sp. NJR-2017a WRK4]
MDIEKFEEIRLSRAIFIKTVSIIIIEFTNPEDINKIIDENLIWQSEYKTNIVYSYYTEKHNSKDCSTKIDKSIIRKYIVYKGVYKRYLVRKTELSKVKTVYNTYQLYYFVLLTKEKLISKQISIGIILAESVAIINRSQRGRLNTNSTKSLLTLLLLPNR